MKKLFLVFLVCVTPAMVFAQVYERTDEESSTIKEGIRFLKKGDFTTAISLFTQAICEDENDCDAYYFRGNAYLLTQQYENAIKDCSKLLQLDNMRYYQITQTWLNRGNAYRLIGNYNEAIINFTRVIIDSTKNSEVLALIKNTNEENIFDIELETAYSYRAMTYHEMKDYQNALNDTLILIQLYPSNEIYYFNAAQNYLGLDQYLDALEYFTKTININNKYAWAYYRRSICYMYLDDFIAAKKDLQKAVEIEPNNRSFIEGLKGIEKYLYDWRP
jgi:tetratricopeptide (TPR) repeat protein